VTPANANATPALAAVPDAPLPADGTSAERLRGALLMATSALAFSVMSLFVKMASDELPTMEIVAVRSVAMTVLSLGFMRIAGVSRRGVNRRLLAARGLVGAGALSLLYAGLGRLPLGDAVTIQNTAPVWTALFAALVLGERLRRGIVLSVAASLVGVALVARPAVLFGAGTGGLDGVGVALVVAAAILMGLAYTAVRRLRETDHPLAIIYALSWAGILLSVPFALGGGWQWPSAGAWALLGGVAVSTQVGQWTLTRGLYLLDAATATAVGYVQVVFAFTWGVLVFGDVPTAAQVAGAAVVVASVLALVSRRPASALPHVPARVAHPEMPGTTLRATSRPAPRPARAPSAVHGAR
jgi:drug/metabolite transporter (DMT)-like permease